MCKHHHSFNTPWAVKGTRDFVRNVFDGCLFVCLTSCFIVHASLSYTVDGILGTSPFETAANGMFVTQNVERLGLNPTEP